jgi:predicted DNA binding CopG/RHH family protein
MIPPKLKNLMLEKKGTETIRREVEKSRKIKITINIDEESLHSLRDQSNKTGIPYQRLLNQILRESLQRRESHESRLERLEREILKLKKKVA